jgi:hypothetical protein
MRQNEMYVRPERKYDYSGCELGMKLVGYCIILFVTLCTLSCGHRVESFGIYTIYTKSDNPSLYILEVEDDNETYSYSAEIRLNLKTLVNYNAFLVDKYRAYGKYEMDDGCRIFPINEADMTTFHVLENSMYAKDKNHVYFSRNGILEGADVKTFEVKNGRGWDKDNFFQWDQIDNRGFSDGQ